VLRRSNRKIHRVGTLKRFGGFQYFRHPRQTPLHASLTVVGQKETKEPLRADYCIRQSLYNDVDDLMPESRALVNNNNYNNNMKKTTFCPS